MKHSQLIRRGGSILVALTAVLLSACGSNNNNAAAPIPGPIVPGGVCPTCVGGNYPIATAAGENGDSSAILGLQFLAQGTAQVAMGSYSGPVVATGSFDYRGGFSCFAATGGSMPIPPGHYQVQVITPGQWANGYLAPFQMQAVGPAQITMEFDGGYVNPAMTGSFVYAGNTYSYYLVGTLKVDALNGTPCTTGGSWIIGQ